MLIVWAGCCACLSPQTHRNVTYCKVREDPKLTTSDLTENDLEVLKRYPKAIYHLRSQLQKQKLLPIFGAGVGKPLGLPNWNELVSSLASNESFSGLDWKALASSQATLSQALYHHFRTVELTKLRGGATNSTRESALEDRQLAAKWRELVKECLYRHVKPVATHPYLAEFLPAIRKAPLTVNYNFDDTLQELLDANPTTTDGRGFETIWEPSVQYRHSSSVIYHPNGFLPRSLARGPSPSLVFLEESFADQMLDVQRGHYSTLLSHLFRYTSLLVGLSLADPTLKHLLRQSASANPGHVHYYVAYRSSPTSQETLEGASIQSNFHTYNLVTLFLSSPEIASLAKLVSISGDRFSIATDELGLPKSYTYYISGAVGAGKTSALSFFKSLNSFDEWLEPKPETVRKAADQLTPKEKIELDDWIDVQMRRRNLLVGNAEGTINVVDRSPIDPLAFQLTLQERTKRATQMLELYKNSRAGVTPGQVLVLEGNPEVMHTRIVDRHKGGNSEYIKALQGRFSELCSSAPHGVRNLNCVDFDLGSVVRRISASIHLEEYEELDLDLFLAELTRAGT
jgi:hypothetical protein